MRRRSAKPRPAETMKQASRDGQSAGARPPIVTHHPAIVGAEAKQKGAGSLRPAPRPAVGTATSGGVNVNAGRRPAGGSRPAAGEPRSDEGGRRSGARVFRPAGEPR